MITYNNPQPIIDLVEILKQIKTNSTYFKTTVLSGSSKKLVDQYTPDLSALPACGISCEYGDFSEAVGNSTRVQIMDITICCTIILQANNDLTGAGPQINFLDEAIRELMKCLYNWQPSNKRYINGFKNDRFERIESLSGNAYETYCMYFTIPAQIDFTDGYLKPEQSLLYINTDISTEKNKTINHINIQNNHIGDI